MFLLFSWILGSGVFRRKKLRMSRNSQESQESRKVDQLSPFSEKNGDSCISWVNHGKLGDSGEKVLRIEKKCPGTKKVLRRQKKCSGTKKVLRNKKKWFRTTFSLFRHLVIQDHSDHRKSRKS